MPPLRPILLTKLLGSVLATCAAVHTLPAQDSFKPQGAPSAEPPAPTTHPLLWRIDGITPSYLYGTIHVADRRIVNLPDAVVDALRNATVVYTETPPADEATESEMERLLLPAGETLGSIMPADLRVRLARYLEKRGYSLQRYEKLNLWAVTLQATMLDEVQVARRAGPLDEALHQRAVDAGKRTAALETLGEHLDIFEQLSPEQHLAWLRSTLDVLEDYDRRGVNPTEELIRLYLEGDERTLREKVTESFPTDPELRKLMVEELLDRRNVRMSKRIVDKLNTERRTSHFFAIGAGHLAGPNGVLQLLRHQGFKPKRIQPPPQQALHEVELGERDTLENLLRQIRDDLRALRGRVDALEKRIEHLETRRR